MWDMLSVHCSAASGCLQHSPGGQGLALCPADSLPVAKGVAVQSLAQGKDPHGLCCSPWVQEHHQSLKHCLGRGHTQILPSEGAGSCFFGEQKPVQLRGRSTHSLYPIPWLPALSGSFIAYLGSVCGENKRAG